MEHYRHFLSNGKTIEVFDQIFTSPERHNHISIAQECSYTLGGSTNDIFENKRNTFFQSCMISDGGNYITDDFERMNFLTSKSFDPIRKYISGYYPDRSWMLSSSPLSKYSYHCDSNAEGEEKTLLYYVNYTWDKNWGGETLFENDQGECEIAINYKPGRIVIFDGSISHRPASISVSAEEFRFTFVIQFLKKSECNIDNIEV